MKLAKELTMSALSGIASLTLLVAAATGAIAAGKAAAGHELTQVYANNDFQLTGITVSKSGRMFLNFPRWSDRYQYAVVELLPNGSTRPFPDETWNKWDGKAASAGKAFVCVQSVVVDSNDTLWVLDPAAPLLGPIVPGGPKLVQIDVRSNKVARVIPFGNDVAPVNSYLNDVRFDLGRSTAYITDSGKGAIVVVDLKSGRARRLLDGHPSVLADPKVDIAINGKPVRNEQGKPPQFNSDGITLSPDGDYLYYQALTGATLYRIKTSVLRNAGAQPAAVAAAVETVGKTFPVDGLWMDAQNRLYLSDLTHNAISRRASGGRMETLITDPRLQWPDTFTQGADGTMYVTTSRIHQTARFNKGKDARNGPYAVYKFRP
jgi:sugar lactone lactonase YvrE